MYQQLEGKGVGTNKVEGIARGMVDDDLSKRGFKGSNSKFKMPEGWGFSDGGKGSTSTSKSGESNRTGELGLEDMPQCDDLLASWEDFLEVGNKVTIGVNAKADRY